MRLLLPFAFLTGLASALLLGAPVAFLARAVSDQPLFRHLADDATLLRGSAELPLAGALADIRWETQGLTVWPSAMTGTIGLRADGLHLDGAFSLGWTVQLDEARISIDMERMADAWRDNLARPQGVADGTVSLRGLPPDHAEGTVQWRGAALDLAGGLGLGDVQGVISTAPPGDILVALSNEGGQLALVGTLHLRGGVAHIDVLAAPRDPSDAALSNLLGMAAVPEGGRWRLRRTITLGR